jgi:hypothetical protein
MDFFANLDKKIDLIERRNTQEAHVLTESLSEIYQSIKEIEQEAEHSGIIFHVSVIENTENPYWNIDYRGRRITFSAKDVVKSSSMKPMVPIRKVIEGLIQERIYP